MTSTRAGLGLLLVRVALVGLVSLLGTLVWWFTTGSRPFPPGPMVASLALLPVNVFCLWLVRRLYRRHGRGLRDVFGGSPRDLGWGLLWVVVLWPPFVLTIFVVMWLLHGAEMFTAFETVFFDADAVPALPAAVALNLGVLTVLTFAPLNAPAEELVYRGYAQSALATRWPVGAAIACSAVAFGLQHAFFAPTRDAMIVYVGAFTVWGLGSGLIVARQGRLLPITIAHFLVNLATSAPALVFPLVAPA
jgi:membrane protease YdiL (CAAX protease family)